jgi:hypothetical protein
MHAVCILLYWQLVECFLVTLQIKGESAGAVLRARLLRRGGIRLYFFFNSPLAI